MLWMGDEEGCCRFLNAALREFWGVDPQKLDDWSSTLHPDDIDALRAPFTKGMTDHAPFSDQLNSLELELRLNLHLSIKTL